LQRATAGVLCLQQVRLRAHLPPSCFWDSGACPANEGAPILFARKQAKPLNRPVDGRTGTIVVQMFNEASCGIGVSP